MRTNKTQAFAKLSTTVAAVLLSFAVTMSTPANAQAHYTVLHSFTKSDGGIPEASLIMDSSGNFYGTTFIGGAKNAGTVFRMDAAGNVNTLHEFDVQSGAGPMANLTEAHAPASTDVAEFFVSTPLEITLYSTFSRVEVMAPLRWET
jgi:uncharacterized repeat protein (TIGR03803 family)